MGKSSSEVNLETPLSTIQGHDGPVGRAGSCSRHFPEAVKWGTDAAAGEPARMKAFVKAPALSSVCRHPRLPPPHVPKCRPGASSTRPRGCRPARRKPKPPRAPPVPESRWGCRGRARLRDAQGHLPCRGSTRGGAEAGRASRRGPGGLLVRRVRGTQPSPLGSRGLPSAPQVQGRARASAGPGTRPSDAGSPLPAPGARPSQARGHPRPAPSRVLTLLSGGTCHPEEAQTSTRSDDFPQSDATAAPEVPPRARLVLRHTCGR